MNVDFYHYFIGREDQSVSEESLKKKCSHQILISKEIFKSYRLADMKKISPKLAKYMYHEVVLMMTIATAFTRLNKTKEAEKMVADMWREVAKFDRKLAIRVHRASYAAFINLPGRAGRNLGLMLYRLAHKFVAFN
jgi:hypothetical protein